MNELLNQLNFDYDQTFSITSFLINIVLCTILLYILSVIYVKYGRSLSNRNQLSKVLILVGVCTFIIISIVKSSLALSLGLVGALSIIRFRTAIKEPEELAYFFIAIAIGLGFGANQLWPTLIGSFVLFAIIYFASKKKIVNSINQNLIISLRDTKKDLSEIQENITSIISQHSLRTELIRLNVQKNELDFNFLVVLNDYENINKVSQDLRKLDSGISITFIDSQNMTI